MGGQHRQERTGRRGGDKHPNGSGIIAVDIAGGRVNQMAQRLDEHNGDDSGYQAHQTHQTREDLSQHRTDPTLKVRRAPTSGQTPALADLSGQLLPDSPVFAGDSH
jgi:hypothetical protein